MGFMGFGSSWLKSFRAQQRPEQHINAKRDDTNSDVMTLRVREIVRIVMNGTGMLSTSYRFRITRLVHTEPSFAVFIELPANFHTNSKKFSEIKRRISNIAENQGGIIIKKVYWRVDNDPVLPSHTERPLANSERAAFAISRQELSIQGELDSEEIQTLRSVFRRETAETMKASEDPATLYEFESYSESQII